MENNSLYHYTTLEGFHCIVNNGTPDKLRFHATHIRYLNDMSEYVYYQNLLWKSLKRHRKIVSEEAFNKFISSCDLFSDPYILSLSKNDDSLPMWHMYDGGNGFFPANDDQQLLGTGDSRIENAPAEQIRSARE